MHLNSYPSGHIIIECDNPSNEMLYICALYCKDNTKYRNLKKWIKINNYNYGNVIYYNYIYFLSDFSNKNKATKCLYLLNLHLEISKLKKLNCKDYRIKRKEWIA